MRVGVGKWMEESKPAGLYPLIAFSCISLTPITMIFSLPHQHQKPALKHLQYNAMFFCLEVFPWMCIWLIPLPNPHLCINIKYLHEITLYLGWSEENCCTHTSPAPCANQVFFLQTPLFFLFSHRTKYLLAFHLFE